MPWRQRKSRSNTSKHTYAYIQLEAAAQRNRVDALEVEKESLKQQIAELRDNLSKSRGSYDDLTKQLENMVAR